MSRKALEDLPDEILERIFWFFRDQGYGVIYPYRHTHGPKSGYGCRTKKTQEHPEAALYDLCLLSRRLNGPATRILYENVQLENDDLRRFIMTVLSSRHCASLVRRVSLDPINDTSRYSYNPKPCWDISCKSVEEAIIDYSTAKKLPLGLRKFPGDRKWTASGDFEQLVAIDALPNLTTLDLTLAGESLHIQNERTFRWLEPRYLFHVLCERSIERSDWLRRIKSINMQCEPSGADLGIGINELAPLFKLEALRNLKLTNCRSQFIGPTDTHESTPPRLQSFREALEQIEIIPTSIDTLTLSDCYFNDNDFATFIEIMPQLHDFEWHLREFHIDKVFEDGSCFQPSQVVSFIEPVRQGLKKLVIRAADGGGGGHLWEVRERQWSSGIDRQWGQQQHKAWELLNKLADLSNFPKLEVLHISAAALGFITNESTKGSLHGILPPSLTEMVVYLPDCSFCYPEEFPVNAYRHSKEKMSVCVERAVELFEAVRAFGSETKVLKAVRFDFARSWGWPTQDMMDKVLGAVDGSGATRLFTEYDCNWRFDSDLSWAKNRKIWLKTYDGLVDASYF